MCTTMSPPLCVCSTGPPICLGRAPHVVPLQRPVMPLSITPMPTVTLVVQEPTEEINPN